ncbi:MAG: SDR family oxidoreductase [Bacteroidia bacterium]
MIPLYIKEKISQTRFLITGGAGFIGSNLAYRLIEEGASSVIVLDDLSTGFEANIEALKSSPGFRFIKGDIRDYETCVNACKDVDVVLHQAALGSVPRSIDNPIATNSVNVDGFLNMLNAARMAGVNRFVYASSSSVYGDDATMPKIEDKTGELLSPYAVSKHTNEKYAKVFSRVYNMENIGLRYFNVFGPRQNVKGPYAAVIPLFIQAMLRGERPTIFGDGKNTRDFTFIENVVNANILAGLTSGIGKDAPILNIAFGGTISLNDLYHMLAKIAGFSELPHYAPERKGDIRNSYANIEKAQQLLQYSPSVGIEEGLRLTFDWYKNNH